MTPSEGKDSDSSDPRKKIIILMFLFHRFSFFSSFFPSPPSAVVVNFIGTKKSNSAFELFLFSFSHSHFLLLL